MAIGMVFSLWMQRQELICSNRLSHRLDMYIKHLRYGERYPKVLMFNIRLYLLQINSDSILMNGHCVRMRFPICSELNVAKCVTACYYLGCICWCGILPMSRTLSTELQVDFHVATAKGP